MKLSKNLLVMFLLFSLLLTNLQPVSADIPELHEHWAERTLNTWIARQLIKGYEDGTIKPDKTVSRIEFAVMVNRQLGYTKTAIINFYDVKSGSWMYKDAALAIGTGYLSGFTDRTFRPNSSFTRLDAAVAIAKVLGLKDVDTGILKQFKDEANIPAVLKGKVSAIVDMGIMSGTPEKYFYPYKTLTRAELVTILDRAIGPDGPVDKQYENPLIGNTAANVENQEGPVIKGGYLYDTDDYYRRTPVSKLSTINISTSDQLNVTDKYVFYVYSNKLIRRSLDGTGEKVLLSNMYITRMQVFDSYIYFTSSYQGGGFYRANLDGTGLKRIISGSTDTVNITKDYIYYKEINGDQDRGYIYRINKDGSNKRLVSNKNSENMVVWGPSIYFTDRDYNYRISRIALDGTGYTVLNNDRSSNLNIYNGIIYYRNEDDLNKVYSIKTGGTGRRKVADLTADNITITGGKLFYINKEKGWQYMNLPLAAVNTAGTSKVNPVYSSFLSQQGNFIYYLNIKRYDINGKNGLALVGDNYEKPKLVAAQNEWLYYTTEENNILHRDGRGRLYKVRTDGTGEQTELLDKTISEFVIAGDWIYGILDTPYYGGNIPGVGLLYKVRTDGTDEGFVRLPLMESIYTRELNVLDSWIYFINVSDNNTVYKIKTDGTGLTKLSDKPTNQLAVTKDKIYFDEPIERSPVGNIWSMEHDGSNQKSVGEIYGRSLYADDDRLVYAHTDKIYTSMSDGTNERVAATPYDGMITWGDEIYVSGDYVYFEDHVTGYRQYNDIDLFKVITQDVNGYGYEIMRQEKIQ